MTDPFSLADLLNPAVVRGYMTEAGYGPAVAPLPLGQDVPAAPPPEEVEFRGVIEFAAYWERPSATNKSQRELIEDVMAAMSGQRAYWLPRLVYHVTQLSHINPNAPPVPQAADVRPVWRHPVTGTLWRINPDGTLSADGAPVQPAANGWIELERARLDREALAQDLAMRQGMEMRRQAEEMQRQADAYQKEIDDPDQSAHIEDEDRLTALEVLGAELAERVARMEEERASKRARKREPVVEAETPEIAEPGDDAPGDSDGPSVSESEQ